MRTSDNGAKTSVYLCSSSDVSNISGGVFFIIRKISKTSNGANNSQDADRLWDISLQLYRLNLMKGIVLINLGSPKGLRAIFNQELLKGVFYLMIMFLIFQN